MSEVQLLTHLEESGVAIIDVVNKHVLDKSLHKKTVIYWHICKIFSVRTISYLLFNGILTLQYIQKTIVVTSLCNSSF